MDKCHFSTLQKNTPEFPKLIFFVLSAERYLCKLFVLCSILVYGNASYAANFRLVTVEFPPLHYADAKGQATGAAVEIVRDVLKGLGHTADISVVPWSRALSFCRDGEIDGMFTVYRLPEYEAILDFSKEVFIPHIIAIYTSTGKSKNFSGNPADLAAGTIGTVNAISYGERFDKLKERLKLERVESLDSSFKMLTAGRIDYVVSNRYSAEFSIRNLAITNSVVEMSPPIDMVASYFAFSKKSTAKNILNNFDAALREFKKSPRYQQILDQYHIKLPET